MERLPGNMESHSLGYVRSLENTDVRMYQMSGNIRVSFITQVKKSVL